MGKLQILIVLLAFIPLSGAIGNLLTGNIYLWENLIVATTLFLGFFGLESIYVSAQIKDKRKQMLLLIFGFLSVLIAYFSLELAYRTRQEVKI